MTENSKAQIDCSIIIPNLHSPIIDRTIRSILAQETEHTFEIIVVGMDKYNLVAQFPEVRFIQTDKPVPTGIARNMGAKKAIGEIVIFIDADCLAEPNWMEAHLEDHHDLNPGHCWRCC